MKKNNIPYFVFVLLFSISFNGYGQFPGCPSVDAGSDITLDCSTSCVDLTATPFEAGATNTYAVSSIPYAPPVAFNQTGGTAVSVNVDDVWSSVITLPFNFCFYGQTYSTAQIGSNGAISLGSNYSTGIGSHPWQFSNSVPSTSLPSGGGKPGNIFGPYHDVDPSIGGTIKYYLLGTAPCRIFAVVFNGLPQYNGSHCPGKKSSFMMVLYETTNAIDVYVERKDLCTGWNSGNAVIGIQNNAGTLGITPPGRNTGNWTIPTSSPEGWRFSPDGAPIYTVDWLQGGNVIGTGETINVCPVGQTEYVARVTYTPCSGGSSVVVTDAVTVNPDPNAPELTEVSVAPANCSAPDGSLEVSADNGAGSYQFSIDNGNTFQSSGVFSNLPSGSYSVSVKDANDCFGGLTVVVPEINPLILTVTSTDITCFGEDDGGITASSSNGSTPYLYSFNGGTAQSNTDFQGLTPGIYQLEVEDFNGCARDTTIEIIEPVKIVLSGTPTNASCFGFSDGKIETSIIGGVPNYTYAIDGSTPQAISEFDNLVAGTYEIVVIDGSGCTDTINSVITEPAAPITDITTTDPSYCAEGTTQVQTTGVTTGTYSSDPSSGLVISPSTGEIDLSNSNPGIYDIIYTFEENSCNYTDTTPVEIFELPVIVLQDTIQICDGQVWIPDATGANSYSWSNGIENGDSVQGVIGEEIFYVTGTSVNGCTAMDSVIVITNASPNVALTADPMKGMPPLEVTFENVSNGADNYNWDFGDGFSIQNNDSTITHIYGEVGIYQAVLVGLTDLGCSDTAFVNIVVVFPEMEYEFPNVFTPNNDGENDYFKLINPKNIAGLEIIILNRWGNLVYESNDVNFIWNGKVKNSGAICDDGTYFYKARLTDLSGKEVQEHGFVHLVIGK